MRSKVGITINTKKTVQYSITLSFIINKVDLISLYSILQAQLLVCITDEIVKLLQGPSTIKLVTLKTLKKNCTCTTCKDKTLLNF